MSCETCTKECSNTRECTCPWLNCPNHGHCCDCIQHHKEVKHPPLCLPQKGYDVGVQLYPEGFKPPYDDD